MGECEWEMSRHEIPYVVEMGTVTGLMYIDQCDLQETIYLF